jgi:hypothetical protein
MKNNSFYFSHDYNVRTDIKIRKLIQKHGYLGYGIFWALVEDLYNNANALPTDCDGIAYELRTQPEIVKSVIYDFGLFEFNDDFFYSNSVGRRLDERKTKSENARKSALKKWETSNSMRTHSDRNANAEQVECDGNAIKERKGKEKKEKEIENKNLKSIQETNTTKICESTNAPTQNFSNGMQNSNLFRQPTVPTLEEVEFGMSQAGGTKEMAKAFFEKYEATGWFLNGSPIVNWKALANRFVANWRTKDQNQPYQPPKTTYVVKTPREDW